MYPYTLLVGAKCTFTLCFPHQNVQSVHKRIYFNSENKTYICIAFFNKKYQLMIPCKEISQWRPEGVKAGRRYFRKWEKDVFQHGSTPRQAKLGDMM